MQATLTLRPLASACALAAALACGVPAAHAQISNDVVRIGFITDMSGPYADTDGLGGLEAIRMVEDGVASAEDIDKAMTLGYKHPVGPLRLTDLVGLDVRLAIARYLHDKLGARFEPPALLCEKVAAGELGRKSGVGFFDYRA